MKENDFEMQEEINQINSKYKIEEIFGDHPHIFEQIEECKNTFGKVNEVNVSQRIASLFNLKMIKMREKTTGHGVINKIFFIKAQEDKQLGNPTTNARKFVLRISNPHRWWKGNSEYQITVMKLAKENTKIPVPTILDYSYNQSTSYFGCEYILMECCSGFHFDDPIVTKFFEENEEKKKIFYQNLSEIYSEFYEMGERCGLETSKMGCINKGKKKKKQI